MGINVRDMHFVFSSGRSRRSARRHADGRKDIYPSDMDQEAWLEDGGNVSALELDMPLNKFSAMFNGWRA